VRNPLTSIKETFTDSSRRSRLVIWVLVGAFVMVGLTAGSQIITSTPWFCNEVCHNVHADNAKAWHAGSHANINCVACHYEPNMNAASFLLDRVDKLVDIPPTIANTFEVPVNGESHMALTVSNEQCEQCHDLSVKKITPSRGILIDHEKHIESGINCTACHNRVAHPEEGFQLSLEGNKKKENWMMMTACFRCHQQAGVKLVSNDDGFKAPGQCGACHPKDFKLEPKTHDEKNWYQVRGDSKGHAEAAKEEFAQTEEALAEWEAIKPELESKQPRVLARLAGVREEMITRTSPSATVNECYTCHQPKFCDDCHGTQIPHAEDFKKQHSKNYKEANAVQCAKCHNQTGKLAYDSQSCHLCHHKPDNPAKPWRLTHDDRAKKVDISKECYSCHSEIFCSTCHVRGEPATPY